MAIIRWDPFRELVTVQDEVNRLFGRTRGTAERVRPRRIEVKARA